MSAFTPASEVLLRHSDFEEAVFCLPEICLPARLTVLKAVPIPNTHHWQVLSRQMGERARFSLGGGTR